MNQPSPGEIWTYRGIPYRIHDIEWDGPDSYAVISMEDNKSDRPHRYPLGGFGASSDDGEELLWKLKEVATEYRCNSCEERAKMPGDYLCKECRYGG